MGRGLMCLPRNAAAFKHKRLYSAPPRPVMAPRTITGTNMCTFTCTALFT